MKVLKLRTNLGVIDSNNYKQDYENIAEIDNELGNIHLCLDT